MALVLLLAASTGAAAGDETGLAIRGYDPVAYFTLGRATAGRPGIEYAIDGRRWRFASAEHRELFKADPARYLPQYNTFCAMALTRGELIEPDPESWMIIEGKLYLFGAAEGPARFGRDLAGNIRRANENRWLTEK